MVHDLVIGNVSTVTLLVLLAVARWEGLRAGALLGLVILLMPKPHLLPVLVYLAFARRREFGGAMITILVGVLLGLAMFGTEPWLAFVERSASHFERTFTANVGFSGPARPSRRRRSAWRRRPATLRRRRCWPAGVRGYGLSIVGRHRRGALHVHPLSRPGRSSLPSQRACARDRAGSHRSHGSWSYFPSFRSGWLGLAWVVHSISPPPEEAVVLPAAARG